MPLVNTLPENDYEEFLKKQLEGMGAQEVTPVPVGNDRQFIANFAQSMNQLGTLGGRSADSSALSKYASLLDEADKARNSQAMAQNQQRNNLLGELAKIRSNEAIRNQDLAQRSQEKADTIAQQNQRDRTQYEREIDLLNRKTKASENLAQVKAEQNIAQKPSEATKMVDREFGKDYNDFVVKGGYGTVQKGIKQLDSVAKMLDEDSSLTGPLAGRTPDWIRSFTNPAAVNARQQVEDVVQKSLKEILGAQFTQREGEQILARAYNPALDAQTNAANIRRLVTSLKTAAESKLNAAKYFEENGTLQGFRGTVANSVDDILADLESSESPPQSSIAQQQQNGDIKAMNVGGQAATQPFPTRSSNPAKLEAQAVGSKRVINGTNYVKAADGLWYEE